VLLVVAAITCGADSTLPRFLILVNDLLSVSAPSQPVPPVAPLDSRIPGSLQEQIKTDALAIQPRDQEVELGKGQPAVLRQRQEKVVHEKPEQDM